MLKYLHQLWIFLVLGSLEKFYIVALYNSKNLIISSESAKYALRAPLISAIGENSLLPHLSERNGLEAAKEKYKWCSKHLVFEAFFAI